MPGNNFDETMAFKVAKEEKLEAREILLLVYQALTEKGYNPINQMVGYLLSGDPAYITSHNNARNLIRKLERDELLEELVKHYLVG
ncbi:MAG: IreB family regulatory phosphoprotein [Bacillota bacterium]